MNNDNFVNLKVRCRCCGKECPISVDLEDLGAWQRGEKLVQDAFPYLSASKRELLLTRTCPECWDRMFAQYDD